MFVGIFDCIFHCVLAETSVTIDDIVYVIDTGKVKMTNFDVKANIATFKPEWISLANSKQRKGRAGRKQTTRCPNKLQNIKKCKKNRYLLLTF